MLLRNDDAIDLVEDTESWGTEAKDRKIAKVQSSRPRVQDSLGLVLDWLELAKIGSHWIPCRRLVHRLLIEMVLDW